MQLTILKSQVLMGILAESEDMHVDRTMRLKTYQKVIIYLQYAAYVILPAAFLGAIFFLVVNNPSFLGLVSMASTVVVLRKHANEFWKQSAIPIGILAQSFVFVIYMVDFCIFVAVEYLENPELIDEDKSKYDFLYNVIRTNLLQFGKEDRFFTQIFWMYVIIGVCFVQHRINRFESLFQITVPSKPVPSSAHPDEAEPVVIIEDDVEPGARPSQQPAAPDHRRLKAIYDFEEPIRNCFWFKAEIASVFMYNYGVTMTMLMTVAAIFVKLNVTSVLYLFVLYKIYSVNFYPSRFISRVDDPVFKQSKALVDQSISLLIHLTSVFILVEYFLFTLHDFSKTATVDEPVRMNLIATWETAVTENLCFLAERPEASKEDYQYDTCLDDWNNWLSIGRNAVTPNFFLVQYFLLMFAYLTRHFTKNDLHNTNVKPLPEPVSGDSEDFTEHMAKFVQQESAPAS